MRRFFLLSLSLLVAAVIGVVPLAIAQPTAANTRIVYSMNGAFLTETIADPAIQFVVFQLNLLSQYQDPGYLSQPAEVRLKGPYGISATVELEKFYLNIGPGKPYPVLFADGSRTVTIEEADPYEAFARYLAKIYPGITLEQLRRMYSPEELDRQVDDFMTVNRGVIANEGVTARAILHKDACAPTLKTYRARLVVDLRGISAEDRAKPIKVAGAIKTIEPEMQRAAIVKTGDQSDGALKGKLLVMLQSKEPQKSAVRFVQYDARGPVRSMKAKKLSAIQRNLNLYVKSGFPKFRKAKKVTVEHIGPDGQSVYAVCAPLILKKPVKLNGFK